MNEIPTLVFLHGVGDGDPSDNWKAALEGALYGQGYPGLESVNVIAPKYAHLLKAAPKGAKFPPAQPKKVREDSKAMRRAFERRLAALEFRLGAFDSGHELGVPGVVLDIAKALPQLAQVKNYLSDDEIRASVLSTIIEELPTSGRVLIIGHSLGSVIGADLLRYLPLNVDIAGFVTIGSPLGHAGLEVDGLRAGLKEAPSHLQWWVNFWNPRDPVSAFRGLSSSFPWMLDYQVGATAFPMSHYAVTYLAEPVVAESIGYGLFGAKTKDVVIHGISDTEKLNAFELQALIGLRYAHLLKDNLEGDTLERFTGALAQVQGNLVQQLRHARTEQGDPSLPAVIARLDVDLSALAVVPPIPKPITGCEKEDSCGSLIALLVVNVMAPFEIKVSEKSRKAAMRDLTAEMGLGGKFGVQVAESVQSAQSALRGNNPASLVKWGAVAFGAVALAVASGGLAIAAAPGLAGAAAITSALASFGPGGMVGGLVTAGALASAGGGSVAVGLSGPGTSAANLENALVIQLAAAMLRKDSELPEDQSIWLGLAESERRISRDVQRLDEYSDRDASNVAELKTKLKTVRRAIEALRKIGLEPGHAPETEKMLAPAVSRAQMLLGQARREITAN